jgi:hypothetical protein
MPHALVREVKGRRVRVTDADDLKGICGTILRYDYKPPLPDTDRGGKPDQMACLVVEGVLESHADLLRGKVE